VSSFEKMRNRICILLIFGFGFSSPAGAFWLLNFQTAPTLEPGKVAFIGGTGGQLTVVGNPGQYNFTPFLSHFGVRLGLIDHLDVGYRLLTVALPYSSVGPNLGGEIDFKYFLSSAQDPWQFSLIGGLAYAYVDIFNQSKSAWSPGFDIMVTHPLGSGLALSLNGRYVYTGIPTASGGEVENNLTASGGSIGLSIPLGPTTAIKPEMGLFNFNGQIGGNDMSGLGAQYGVVFSSKL